MTSRPVLTPSAAHPITIRPTSGRVTVRIGSEVVADTGAALTLQESTYPAVQYIPRAHVNPAVLRPSATATYCPFKGDASYFSVVTSSGQVVEDAIWTYEQPHAAVAVIAGYVACYPNKADIVVTG